jgi:DNA-binding NarL/FixJ family response regulator
MTKASRTRNLRLVASNANTQERKNLLRAAVAGWTQRYELTAIEASILGDAIRGVERPELAERRFVSVETMKTNIRRLLRKTGDRSLVQAARRLLFELVFGETPWEE